MRHIGFLLYLFTIVGLHEAFTKGGVDDGLIVYYAFEQNTYDISGNGNHATEVGALTFTAGAIGDALVLDEGIDDFIVIDHPLLGINTIHLWFKSNEAIGPATSITRGLFGRPSPAAPYLALGRVTAQLSDFDEMISVVQEYAKRSACRKGESRGTPQGSPMGILRETSGRAQSFSPPRSAESLFDASSTNVPGGKRPILMVTWHE